MDIEQVFRYASFTDLAYINWSDLAWGDEAEADAAIVEAIARQSAPERIAQGGRPSGAGLASQLFATDQQAWSIAHFMPNDPQTGFAAALFQRSVDDGPEQVLALRGTEATVVDQVIPDLVVADLQEIGGLGLAVSQTVSLINYVRRLAGLPGAAVEQFTLRRGDAAPDGVASLEVGGSTYWLEAGAAAPGLGLIDPGRPLGVTGHSLGGHLAALALRLFPQQFTAAVAFNAPGFDAVVGADEAVSLTTRLAAYLHPGVGLLALVGDFLSRGAQASERFVDDLFAAGAGLAPAADFDGLAAAGRILYFTAEDQAPLGDPSLVAGIVSGRPPAPRTAVTTEVNSHAIGALVDALAVQATLARVDPTLSLDVAGSLLVHASTTGADTLERITDVLSQLLLPGPLPPLAQSVAPALGQWFSGPAPFDARADLHERLVLLQEAAAGHGDLHLVPLAGVAATTLFEQARHDLAWRFALHTLSPFVVAGSAALYEPHAAALAWDDWDAAYWTARAQLLPRLLGAHAGDAASAEGIAYFTADAAADVVDARLALTLAAIDPRDIPVGLRLPTLAALRGGHDDVALVAFAAGAAVTGRHTDDALYGSPGPDDLAGGAGADSLVGGAGDDRIYHAGRDLSEDGAPDRLAGGSGFDRYYLGHGDTVHDSDGAGAIFVGSAATPLAGTYQRVGDNTYRRRDGAFTAYRNADGTLRVVDLARAAPLAISIEAHASGALGIVLDDGAATPSPLNPVTGTPDDDRFSAGGELHGSAGDDRIEGLGGDDDLFGGVGAGPWGADRLLGGPGRDYLSSATLFDLNRLTQVADDPGDFMDGGADGDILVGNGGDDQLYGGSGDDVLAGRDGDDVLHGGPDADILTGGNGADLLIGGSGNDVLNGEIDAWVSPSRAWSSRPLRSADGRVIDVIVSDSFLATTPANDDADVLYGGDGDDFLNGGGGDDALYGEGDDDILFGWRGDDRLDGGAGDDILYGDSFGLAAPGGEGADRLFGGAGDDELFGEGGRDYLDGGGDDDILRGGDDADVLLGGEGADSLYGGDGVDTLLGGEGMDTLNGEGGSDVLDGGVGDDTLLGGPGHDTYVYRAGEGHDVVVDSAGYDTVFVTGLPPGGPIEARDEGLSLRLVFGEAGSLLLGDWYLGAIERLVVGTAVWPGGEPVDAARLLAGAADGAARAAEVYVYRGEAIEVTLAAAASAALSTVVVDGAITPADFAGLVGADGHWRFTAGGASLVIEDWATTAIERFVFGDGSVLSTAEVDLQSDYVPVVAVAPRLQHAVAGFAFDYRVPAATFRDDDHLRFELRAVAAPALPAWLDFDPLRGRLRGTPGLADAGRHAFELTALDPAGHTATTTLAIEVAPHPFAGAAALDPLLLPAAGGSWFGSRAASPWAERLDGVLASLPAPFAHGFATADADPPPDLALRRVFAVAGAGDFDGDGFADLLVGEVAGSGVAAVVTERLVFGRAEPFGIWLDSDAALAAGGAVELVGAGIDRSFHGDIDGDGHDDLVIDRGAGRGAVIYGEAGRQPRRRVVDELSAAQGFLFEDVTLAAVADVDNDGRADIVFDDARVLRGGATRETYAASGAAGAVAAGDLAWFLPLGDFDGDGHADILTFDYDAQTAAVLLLDERGVQADLQREHFRSVRLAGNLQVANLWQTEHGDFNGDGLDDLVLLGSDLADHHDDLRVVFGHRAPATTIDVDALDGVNGLRIDGYWLVEGLGASEATRSFANLGDINGDGIDDLALSDLAYLEHPWQAHVPIVLGSDAGFPALLRTFGMAGDAGFFALLPGLESRDQRVVEAVPVGDVDGDGIDDIAVISPARELGYLARGGAGAVNGLVAGTFLDERIEIEAGDDHVTVAADGGNDEVLVFAAFGVVVDLGPGDDRVEIAPRVGLGSLPAGVSLRSYSARHPIVVHGGDGDETIVVRGDPVVLHLFDTSGAGNHLVLDERYDPAQLSLTPGSIRLDFGPALSEIHLHDFDPQDLLGGPRALADIRFADGRVLDYAALVARGFDIAGSPGDDRLGGTDLVDRIDAGDGDDVLAGHGGDDVLDGGRGDDRYEIGWAGGADVIRDAAGADRIVWAAGIAPEGLVFERAGADLVIEVAGGGRVTILDWYADAAAVIETMEFADGTQAALGARAPRVPTAAPIPAQTIAEDVPWIFAAGADYFSGDDLVFTATRADGAPLPAWLDLDATAGVLGGVPGNDDVGSLAIEVSATDAGGLRVASVFELAILNSNDAPELALALADQRVRAGEAFSYILPDGLFVDVDAGDVLTLTGAVQGTAAAAWITFDPVTRSWRATPPPTARGDWTLETRASDGAGASVSATFVLRVEAAAVVGRGGPGDDVLAGGDGADRLAGGPGDDRLRGGAGADRLYGGPGADVIHAGAGADIVYGGSGDDLLFGEDGHDRLNAGAGDDVLWGGPGHDRLLGEQGDDTYYFALGDGRDRIEEHAGGSDRLRFTERTLAPADLRFARRGSDLEIRLPRAGDGVTIVHWFEHPRFVVERIELADGRFVTARDIDLLVQSMAAFDGPAGSAAPLPFLPPRPDHAVLASAWHDAA
ncbi:MAG: putative Ig domain-containing protein [Gammaproteobacteria bacterium]|nr:putative Ig domain-containing protein [Gammaproteobacteria bacterium]